MRLKTKIYGFLAICIVGACVEAYGHSASPKNINQDAALNLYEKAFKLSPEWMEQSQDKSLTPFFMAGGHKVYLTSGFWDLVTAWVRIYEQEINKHCDCKIDEKILVQEAKDQVAQGFFTQKVAKPTKNIFFHLNEEMVFLYRNYGTTVFLLKATAEVAETILSLFVGGKGLHALCNAIDVLIFPLARKAQTYSRTFTYSRSILNSSGLFAFFKLLWISRKVNQAKDNVFFHLNRSLVLSDSETIKQIDHKGPQSFLRKKGHRWHYLKSLSNKAQPLFEEINNLEQQINQTASQKEIKKMRKRQEKLQAQLDKLLQVDRKTFFGKRYKRFLLFLSREFKLKFLRGSEVFEPVLFNDPMFSKNILWPLSLQENIFQKAVDSSQPLVSSGELRKTYELDEVKEGLIQEFLSRNESNIPHNQLEQYKKSIQVFFHDVESVFDTSLSSGERLFRAQTISIGFSSFALFLLKEINKRLKDERSRKFKIQIQSLSGRFSNLANKFSDFLSAVSINNNSHKIIFYKYESIENFLLFMEYLLEVHKALNQKDLNEEQIVQRLKDKLFQLESFFVAQEKRISFSANPLSLVNPFKPVPRCKEMTKL